MCRTMEFDPIIEEMDETLAEETDLRRVNRPLAPGLYLVATPIGNLEDITLRALRVLRSVDRIACEDTRQTQKLLNHFEIKTPTVSYHMHNEGSRAEELLAELKQGARIAVVSDAGTPGIADPGGQIAAAAIAAGVAVFPVPGANAAVSALIASGLGTERFTFHGFLPAKAGARKTALEGLAREFPAGTTHVFYETPHRIVDTLEDVAAVFGAAQPVVIARELTKLHEEFLRGPVAELRGVLAGRATVRGEMVLLLAPAAASAGNAEARPGIAAEVAAMVKALGISEMDALKRVAKARGLGKSEAYRELQREQKRR
jgi:16S rRNA (cytidine1402-2'-O)-methyltransferase